MRCLISTTEGMDFLRDAEVDLRGWRGQNKVQGAGMTTCRGFKFSVAEGRLLLRAVPLPDSPGRLRRRQRPPRQPISSPLDLKVTQRAHFLLPVALPSMIISVFKTRRGHSLMYASYWVVRPTNRSSWRPRTGCVAAEGRNSWCRGLGSRRE